MIFHIDFFLLFQDLPTKSHSTCSDGSLLSMDSSEMDEVLIRMAKFYKLKRRRNRQKAQFEMQP